MARSAFDSEALLLQPTSVEPVISGAEPRRHQKPHRCSRCGRNGHNQRSCGRAKPERPPCGVSPRNLEILARYQAGELLSSIAKGYGITRERARQIVLGQIGREQMANIKAARMDVTAERATERAIERRTEVVRCGVCLLPMRRRKGSRAEAHRGECARLRADALYMLSQKRRDQRRDGQAKYYLSHPAKVGKAWLAWAERWRAGTAKTWARGPVEGSKVETAWRRVLELREGRTPAGEIA